MATTRERRAISCTGDCGLVEVWPEDHQATGCPSCGAPVERLRTITRRECSCCGIVEPYGEYDGRYIANGLCAHHSWVERVYVCLGEATP